jgi:hypothetical protein
VKRRNHAFFEWQYCTAIESNDPLTIRGSAVPALCAPSRGISVHHPSRFAHLMRGNRPWRQVRERAEKFPGDRKRDPGLRGFSHGVIALRSSIQHRNAPRARRGSLTKREPAWRSWRLRRAGRRRAAPASLYQQLSIGSTVSDAGCE